MRVSYEKYSCLEMWKVKYVKFKKGEEIELFKIEIWGDFWKINQYISFLYSRIIKWMI